MVRLSLALVMACTSFLWATPLTDDAKSANGAIRSLAGATGISVHPSLFDKVTEGYKGLSQDSQYKNAHRVYRLLAAMTLTGDSRLMHIADRVWESGLRRDNTLLQKIGQKWGSNEANEAENRIYYGRFTLEAKRQSAGLTPSTSFAQHQDWEKFFKQNPIVTSATSQAVYWYAHSLWAQDAIPHWYNTLALQKPSVIQCLLFKDKPQNIFGDDTITPSEIHAGRFYASYPQVMVIGSHKAPSGQLDNNKISITTQVSRGLYVVIGQPKVWDDPILRPHYQFSLEEASRMIEKPQETTLKIREANKTITGATIKWQFGLPIDESNNMHWVTSPTAEDTDDGSIKHLASVQKAIQNYDGYSLTVWTSGKDSAAYYYWVANGSQMSWIRGFAQKKPEGFTFEELVKDVTQCSNVSQQIKDDLTLIQNNPTEFFRQ